MPVCQFQHLGPLFMWVFYLFIYLFLLHYGPIFVVVCVYKNVCQTLYI